MELSEVGEGNTVDISPTAKRPKNIKINGSNNSITIADGAILNGFHLTIRGNNNRIVIGKNCSMKGRIFLSGMHSTVEIGEDTTAVDVRITAGGRKKISIGKDCMFSRKIEIRCWDEHPIFDIQSREHINPGRDVSIGNHVWIGVGASINKGSVIPDGCVIGAQCVVSKPLDDKNAIYVGTPARLHRKGIVWGRSHNNVPWETVDAEGMA